MKVKLLDISDEGLNINNTIPLAGLSARLNQGGKSDIEFLSDPKLDITIFKKPSGADMSGTATATYHQSCGRCLDRIERVAEVRVDLELVPKPEGARAGDPAYEDDIGIIFYEDDEIDLAEIVHEALILSLDLYWSPEQDKSGKCTLCDKKVDVTKALGPEAPTKLGDLLKKVGLN